MKGIGNFTLYQTKGILRSLVLSTLLTMLFSIGLVDSVQAQSHWSNILITAPTAADALVDRYSLCTDPKRDTIYMTSDTTADMTNIVVRLDLLTGMYYVGGSVVANVPIVQTSANPPVFTIAGPISHGTDVKISYEVVFDCDAKLLSQSSSLLDYEMDLEYAFPIGTGAPPAPTGSTPNIKSEPFEVLAPTVNMLPLDNPVVMEVTAGQNDSLEVQVINGGVGPMDTLIYRTRNHPDMNIQYIRVGTSIVYPFHIDAGTGTGNIGPDNWTYFYLDANEFAFAEVGPTTDRSDLFQFNEKIRVWEVWQPFQCNLLNPDDTRRQAQFGCGGTVGVPSNCSTDPRFEDQQDGGVLFGTRLPSVRAGIVSAPVGCQGDSLRHTFFITNTGDASAVNLRFSLGLKSLNNGGLDPNNFRIVWKDEDGNLNGQWNSPTPSSVTSGSSCGSVGNSSTDLAYNLSLNALAGSSTLFKPRDTIWVYAAMILGCDCNCGDYTVKGTSPYQLSGITYTDPCGIGNLSGSGASPTQRIANYSGLASGPSFLADGAGDCVTVDFLSWVNSFYSIAGSIPRHKLTFEIDIPGGLDLDKNSIEFIATDGSVWLPSQIIYTDTDDASTNTATIEYTGTPPGTNFAANSTQSGLIFKYCVISDGAEVLGPSPACGNLPLNVSSRTFFTPDTICAVSGSCGNECAGNDISWPITVSVGCPSGGGGGGGAGCGTSPACASQYDFDLERVNYDCGDNNNNRLNETGETINPDLVRRKRIISGDTVRASSRFSISRLSGTCPVIGSPYAYTRLMIPSKIDSFKPLTAQATIYDVSAGTSYFCDVLSFFKDDTVLVVDLSASSIAELGGCPGVPSNFEYEGNDSVVMSVDFSVFTTNVPGGFDRAIIVDSTFVSQNPYGTATGADRLQNCLSLSSPITLVGMTRSYSHSAVTTGGCSFSPFRFTHRSDFGNGSIDWFPYEVRPANQALTSLKMEFPSSFELGRIEVSFTGLYNSGRNRSTTLTNTSPFYVHGADDTIRIDLEALRISLGIPWGSGCDFDQGMTTTVSVYPLPNCETEMGDYSVYNRFAGTIKRDARVWQSAQEHFETGTLSYNVSSTPELIASTGVARVELLGQYACIDVAITNIQLADADFVIFEPVSVSGQTQILSVTETTGGSSTVLPPTDMGIYELGNLAGGGQRTYNVCVFSMNCEADEVGMQFAYACDAFPRTIEEVPCVQEASVTVVPLIAEVQQVVKLPTDELIELCDTVPFMVQVSSSKRASVSNINATFNLPKGMRYVPGSFQIAWPVPFDGSDTTWVTPAEDPENVFGNFYSKVITDDIEILEREGLIGVEDLTKNFMLYRFLGRPDCGFRNGSRATFVVYGFDPCNRFTNYAFSPSNKMRVSGLSAGLFTTAEISPDTINICDGEVSTLTIDFRVSRKSVPTGPTDSITVYLPPGLQYVPGSYSPGINASTAAPIVIDEGGGAKSLNFDLIDNLAPGTQVIFEINIGTVNTGQRCLGEEIRVESHSSVEDTCFAPNGTIEEICDIKLIGSESFDSLYVVKPVLEILEASAIASALPPSQISVDACATVVNTGDAMGTTQTVTVEFYNDLNGNLLWDDGDEYVGSIALDVQLDTDESVQICSTFISPPGKLCRLVAVINPEVACACDAFQTGLIDVQLLQEYESEVEVCSSAPVEIGPAPIEGYKYHWLSLAGSNVGAISTTDTTKTIFSFRNTTGENIVWSYVLRTERVACAEYDTITVTVFPEANDSVPVQLCGNVTSFTISGPVGGTNYSWTPTTGLASPLSSVSLVTTWTGDTKYVLTYDDFRGCPQKFIYDVSFVNCSPRTSLGDTVWLDLNVDGIQDSNEPGIADVTVYLYNASDLSNPIMVTTTDANGAYNFSPLVAGTYVVGFDRPDLHVASPSNVGDDADDSDMISNTQLFTNPIVLNNGDSIIDVDAGFYLGVSLGDTVWLDENRDGVQDSGEPGIEGVVLNLYDANTDEFLGTTTTDANGRYIFEGLPIGDYYVEVDHSSLPSTYIASPVDNAPGGDDFIDSDADRATGIIPATSLTTFGARDTTLDAGFWNSASVGNYVWLDANGDGQQSILEEPVPNVQVVLYSADGTTPLATTYTDANGFYLFDSLVPTTYDIRFFPPAGFEIANQNVGDDDSDSDPNLAGWVDNITLAPGEINLSIDAGLIELSSLGDFVWYDDDQDGVQDTGEPGVVDVLVTLYDNDGMEIATTLTDANGAYLFEDLRPGEYSVGFSPPTNYALTIINAQVGLSGNNDTTDSDANQTTGRTALFNLQSGTHLPIIDAGLIGLVALGDTVWYDIDKNGIQDLDDPLEVGIAGVFIEIINSNTGEIVAETVTDANGRWFVDGLPEGTYHAIFYHNTAPATFEPTTQNVNSNGDDADDSDADVVTGVTASTTLDFPGAVDTTIDAGYYIPASIGNYAWEDVNMDGIQDPSEPAYEGLKIILYDQETGEKLDSTFTDANGFYSFTELGSRNYYLEMEAPDGWAITLQNQGSNPDKDSDVDPLTGLTTTTFLSPGENDTTWDIGIWKYASIGDYVWEDRNADGIQDASEPVLAGVKVTLYDGVGGVLETTLTDVNGLYLFDGLLPGEYQVGFDTPPNFLITDANQGGDNGLDSDADPNTLLTPIIDLQYGSDSLTWDAGFYGLVALGDTVWNDLDGDGLQEPGEPGVANITVSLYTGDGVLVATTFTNADGFYEFDSLITGSYYVVFDHSTLPSSDWIATLQDVPGDDSIDSDADRSTGRSHTVDLLTAGDSDYTLDAGFYLPASLGDYVWEDTNGDGNQDGTEPGVQGVQVVLYSGAGEPLATTFTNSSGMYLFDSLGAGNYYVVFTPPGGYTITDQANSTNTTDLLDSDADPITGQSQTVTLIPGQVDLSIDAGIYQLGSIGDYVWEDRNVDGIQDAAEPILSGVKVTLYDGMGNVLSTTTTDGNGLYLFDNLSPGDYQVGFDNPPNYQITDNNQGTDNGLDSDADPNTLLTPIIVLPSGSDTMTWDAGFYGLVALGDTVWNDLDGDGLQEPGEPGIANVTVRLYTEDGALVATTFTNADGFYEFDSLITGSYYVVFDHSTLPSSDWIATLQDVPGDDSIDSDADRTTGRSHTVDLLTAGDSDYTLDAGFYLPAALGDYVWEDVNGDFVQDAGDEPIEDVLVTLYNQDGLAIATTRTDVNGYYLFDSLGAGNYRVGFTAPPLYTYVGQYAGAVTTMDSNADRVTGLTDIVNLSPGELDNTIDAGLYIPASLGDYVWEDRNGDGIQGTAEPVMSGVKVTLYDDLGNVLQTTATDVNGLYLFDDLRPGNYQIGFDTPPNFLITDSGQGGDNALDSDADPNTLLTPIISLPSGVDSITWDAGFYGLVALGDTVWNDLDGDGIQEPGEPGIADVTVRLYTGDGVLVASTFTNADGFYEFDSLITGSYYVVFDHSTLPSSDLAWLATLQNVGGNDSIDSDADRTTGRTHTVDLLTAGDSDYTLDAGFYLPAELGDYVWEDVNGDFVQDPGDKPIEDVLVTLYNQDGLAIATTLTDANGYYLFDSLLAGNYRVGFMAPPLYSFVDQYVGALTTMDSNADPITGLTDIVMLSADERDTTIDAGLYIPASLGDYVYIDKNVNGIQDAGDVPLDSVWVVLIDLREGGARVDSVLTDATGYYLFDNLRPGDYQVQFTSLRGFPPTAQYTGVDTTIDSNADVTTGLSDIVNLSSGEHDPTIDAGFLEYGAIGDTVFTDCNGNGIQDPGETGIAFAPVQLFYSSDLFTPLKTIFTDPTGYYLFDSLLENDYTVKFFPISGLVASPRYAGTDTTKDSNIDPVTFFTENVHVYPADTNRTIDAGFFGQPFVFGEVWEDDCDGTQGAAERRMQGIRVDLLSHPSGTLLHSTTTNASGEYRFDGLSPGSFVVRFVGTNNYKPTDANVGSDMTDSDADALTGLTQSFTLNCNNFFTQQDAGFCAIVSLGDTVWNDINGDGVQALDEPGIAGVTVSVYNAAGTLIATTATNGDGYYLFDSLLTGDYYVVFDHSTAPAGMIPTLQNQGTNDADDSDADVTTGQTHTVSLPNAGDSNVTLDAGYYLPATLGDKVWLDDDGDGVQDPSEPGIQGVLVTLYDGAGNVLATTLTDGNGNYLFTDLPAGDYQVGFTAPPNYNITDQNSGTSDALDSDADPISGLSQVVSLAPGADNRTVDAGLYLPASLGDYVWWDQNADGIQDSGEPGIQGVIVTLYDGMGGAIATTTTDGTGFYGFDNLAPGDYQVGFMTPANHAPTAQNQGSDDALDSDADPTTLLTQVVNLSSGQHDPTLDAGFIGLVSLGDTVWNDINGNGIQEPGEPGIAGVTVSVYNAAGTLIATTATNGDGYYLFDNLPTGDYYVVFDHSTAPAGMIPTLQNQGTNDADDSDADVTTGQTHTVSLPNAGDSNVTLDAGYYLPATLGDKVWLDDDGDGVQDPSEPGIQGVLVTLYDGAGNVLATTLTDGNGNYLFTDLPAGDYQVGFTAPPNYNITDQNSGTSDALDSDADPISGLSQVVSLAPGADNRTVDAGLYLPASLGDYVWWDQNADGIQDSGEPGIQGVIVTLYDGMGGAIATTTTDGTGFYGFDNLAPGDYQVGFMTPANHAPTAQNQGSDDALDSDADPTTLLTQVVNLSSGQHDPTLDAGFIGLVSLGDTVWNDINGNGIQEPGEPGIAGVTVSVYNAAGTLIATTATNGDGYYLFDNLPTGDYYVVFDHSTAPAGMIPTLQNQGTNDADDSDADVTTGQTHTVSLPNAGDSNMTLDAGYYLPATLGDKVWLDDDGDGVQDPSEPGIQGVLVTLYDGAGNVLATTLTDGNGNYLFTDLPAGDYQVGFTAPPNYNITDQNSGTSDALDSDADPISGLSQVVSLAPGADNRTVDAGLYLPASLGDYVWWDQNADGIQDSGEPGIQGVIVTLYDGMGGAIATTTTDGTGFYGFDNLAPGDYQVGFMTPANHAPTAQNQGSDDALDSDADPTTLLTQVVNLSSGQHDPTLDAGFIGLVSLGDTVWNDINGNGIQEPTEPGIAGVTVSVYNAAGTLIATTATNGDGYYLFDNLPTGDYYVVFDHSTAPAGMIPTLQNQGSNDADDSDADVTTGQTHTVSLPNAGDSNMTLDAGYYLPASLGDYVWFDNNADGIQDSGEPGVQNVLVTLYDGAGNVLATTLTDATGKYLFDDLPAGNYQVGFTAPPLQSWTSVFTGTNPNVDSDADPLTGLSAIVTLVPGQHDSSIDAGLVSCGLPRVQCPANYQGCPGDATIPSVTGMGIDLNSGGCVNAIVTYQDQVTTGTCPGEVYITRTWLAIDQSNPTVSSSCVQIVSTMDDEGPSFVGVPANTVAECDAVPAFAQVIATDECSSAVAVTTSESSTPGSCASNYTLTRIWTATDACGNVSTVSQTIEVSDTRPPTIACPADLSLSTDPGQCSATVPPGVGAPKATATDACSSVEWTNSDTGSDELFGTFNAGTNTLVFVAADACGNESSCSVNVIVTDNELPTIACAADITLSAQTGACSAVAAFTAPAAADNCPGASVSQISGPASGSVISVGTSQVVYQAVDAEGNSATCSFNIIVEDGEAPSITCPANATFNADPVTCLSPLQELPAVVSDNCSGVVVSNSFNAVQMVSGMFPLGLTDVVYTATDASGNVSTCEFSVEVNDVSAPDLVCPADITLSTAPRWCFANLVYNVTAADNCSGAVVPVRTSGPASGSTLPVGSTRVEFTVSDAAGNNSTCGFNVDVYDTHAPEILSCPTSMTVQATVSTPSLCGANVNWTAPTAFEACGVISSNQSHVSGDFFNAGTTTLVRYVFDDGRGNESTCEFSITVGACPAPLPVDLVFFRATAIGETVVCDWETAIEINNDYFVVERTTSPTGALVETVGTVATKGNGTQVHQYDLVDLDPYFKRSYYRLVQFDLDGTKTIFPWQEVYIEKDRSSLEVTAFPNPTRDLVHVRVRGASEKIVFRVYDMQGRLILSEQELGETELLHTIDMERFARGIYNLEVITSGAAPQTIRLSITD